MTVYNGCERYMRGDFARGMLSRENTGLRPFDREHSGYRLSDDLNVGT